MKVEILSDKVGTPGDVIDLDPNEINVDALIEGGFVKPHKPQTKKEKD
jgi:hypothetical protein